MILLVALLTTVALCSKLSSYSHQIGQILESGDPLVMSSQLGLLLKNAYMDNDLEALHFIADLEMIDDNNPMLRDAIMSMILGDNKECLDVMSDKYGGLVKELVEISQEDHGARVDIWSSCDAMACRKFELSAAGTRKCDDSIYIIPNKSQDGSFVWLASRSDESRDKKYFPAFLDGMSANNWIASYKKQYPHDLGAGIVYDHTKQEVTLFKLGTHSCHHRILAFRQHHVGEDKDENEFFTMIDGVRPFWDNDLGPTMTIPLLAKDVFVIVPPETGQICVEYIGGIFQEFSLKDPEDSFNDFRTDLMSYMTSSEAQPRFYCCMFH